MWLEKDITREYKKGDLIISEGDLGREMFIIKSGAVEVLKKDGDTLIPLAVLERGDFFGEMAILEDAPRTAMVVAREATELIVLNVGSFLMKIRRDPSFAFTMMQKMSRRIRILNDRLLTREEKSEAAPSAANLAVAQSEYLRDRDR
jgi:CRP-like cAMP-binding protein